MPFKLMPLPYSENALDPVISAKTISYHYGKHHRGYIDKLNKAVAGREDESKPLEELVTSTAGSLFNNAAQVWNHDFYWNSLKPGGGAPGDKLASAIDSAFGSVDGFRREFAQVAKSHFGSGWAWLAVKDDGDLTVLSTADADTPLRHGLKPLLTLDVWEHSYYLDYQNARAEYVERCIEHLLNWDHATRCFAVITA